MQNEWVKEQNEKQRNKDQTTIEFDWKWFFTNISRELVTLIGLQKLSLFVCSFKLVQRSTPPSTYIHAYTKRAYKDVILLLAQHKLSNGNGIVNISYSFLSSVVISIYIEFSSVQLNTVVCLRHSIWIWQWIKKFNFKLN